MSETKLNSEFDKSLRVLEKFIEKFDSECIKFAAIVLKDERVRKAFVNHIIQGEDFVGITCHNFGIDSTEIVFRFQCRAPKICLISPAFSVQYDIMTQTIMNIRDPYIGKELIQHN